MSKDLQICCLAASNILEWVRDPEMDPAAASIAAQALQCCLNDLAGQVRTVQAETRKARRSVMHPKYYTAGLPDGSTSAWFRQRFLAASDIANATAEQMALLNLISDRADWYTDESDNGERIRGPVRSRDEFRRDLFQLIAGYDRARTIEIADLRKRLEEALVWSSPRMPVTPAPQPFPKDGI